MRAPVFQIRRIFPVWRMLARYPGGQRLFSFLLGLCVPYSGTLGARIKRLDPGWTCIELHERWRLRNHLGSIHAMALANVCELSSGLALLSKLPENKRGIVTGFAVKYVKKARGVITVDCDLRELVLPQEGDALVKVSARDAAGDIVATAEACWRIGSVKMSGNDAK